MLNLFFALSFIVNSNNDLPSLKMPVSSKEVDKITYTVVNPRRFVTTTVSYEEVPVAKETETYELVSIRPFQPVRRVVNALRKVLPEPVAIQRSGTVVAGNNGNPIIVEQNTVTTKKTITTSVDSKKAPVYSSVAEAEQESSEEPRYIIYEDRRVFSGRVRNRIFVGRR